MSSERVRKSKRALTTLVSLFLICLISEKAVYGKSILNDQVAINPGISVDTSSNQFYRLPHMPEQQILALSSSISTRSRHQIRKLTSPNNAGGEPDNRIFAHLAQTRAKRSPYPPGFVAWTWREPCLCPPGQVLSCRCYKAANSNVSSSSEERKFRKRRSRGRKLKVKV